MSAVLAAPLFAVTKKGVFAELSGIEIEPTKLGEMPLVDDLAEADKPIYQWNNCYGKV